MRKRTLGKTNYLVSEIGIGCWQFGGDFGPISDKIAADTLTAAQKNGVTFYDTADVYGAGRSEQIIGAFSQSAQKNDHQKNDHQKNDQETIIATKVGRDAALYPSSYTPQAIEANIRASAERLQTPCLDLVQLHCVPKQVLQAGEIFQVMSALKQQGLIKQWGASVETIEEAHICIEQDDCASLQIIFNLYRQDAIWSLFQAAKAKQVGIIVRLPLASGILTGKFSADHKFDKTDHRNFNRDGASFSVGETFSGIEQSRAIEMLSLIRPEVPEGWGLADFALRWILDHDAVCVVIAGCSHPDQITRNVGASSLPALPAATHERLRDIYLSEIKDHIRCPI